MGRRLAVGYARVALDGHDLAEQREALIALGVAGDCVYVDHGIACAGRDRPGLRDAIAACGPGDTLVVTGLHRLARSVADARDIVEQLTGRGVRLNLGGTVFNPHDPTGRVIAKTIAAVVDFEADLIRSRTREGLKAAKAKGRLRGKPPKLSPDQQARLVDLHHRAGRSPEELAEIFDVARSTVYRVLERARRGAIEP